MELYIKNNTDETRQWAGQYLSPAQYYMIEEVEESTWQHSSPVVVSIANSELVMARDNSGTADILDIAEAISFLHKDEIASVKISEAPPTLAFSTNVLHDGRKLFRRKHGITAVCAPGETIMDMLVPYASCKIDEVEIIGCESTDTVDFLVLDTEQGLAQQSMGVPAEYVTPFLMLNQFGFDVNIADMYYSDSSNYEADLVGGMVVRMVYKNTTDQTKTIGANFVLHEAK